MPTDAERDLLDLVIGKAQAPENLFRQCLTDDIVVVEANPVGGAHKCSRLAHVVKQHCKRQHHVRLGRQGIEHHPCVREHVAFRMILRRLFHAFQRRHLR